MGETETERESTGCGIKSTHPVADISCNNITTLLLMLTWLGIKSGAHH
jgi:hypothetical protein